MSIFMIALIGVIIYYAFKYLKTTPNSSYRNDGFDGFTTKPYGGGYAGRRVPPGDADKAYEGDAEEEDADKAYEDDAEEEDADGAYEDHTGEDDAGGGDDFPGDTENMADDDVEVNAAPDVFSLPITEVVIDSEVRIDAKMPTDKNKQ